ncbi:MFS general substrate transporter [Atractiella rhizophila]|nr:MFS general substrate transporter [Atractiella rhizophila]
MSAMVCFECIISLVSIKEFSHLVNTRGRKRLVIYALLASLLNTTLVIASLTLHSFLLLMLAVVSIGSLGPFLFNLAWQNYIIDLLPEDKMHKRAGWFAVQRGMAGLATAVSTGGGGWIANRTGLLTFPLWIALAVQSLNLLLVLATVRESLTDEAKAELKLQRKEEEKEGSTGFKEGYKRAKRLLFPPDAAGRARRQRSYALLGCGAAYFLSLLVVGFFNQMLMLFTTGRLHYSEKDLGFLLAYYLGIQSIYSILIFPPLSSYGRRLFSGMRRSTPPTTPSITTPLLSEAPSSSPGPNHFDLLFSSLSFALNSGGIFLIGLSKSWVGLLVGLAMAGLSSGAAPSIQAFMTQLVKRTDSLIQGFAVLDAIGLTISPIILGSVYSATLDSAPNFSWFLSAGIYAAAALVLAVARRKNVSS